MAPDVPLTGRLPAAESSLLDDDQATLARQLHRLAVPWAEQAGFAGTDDEGHLIGPFADELVRTHTVTSASYDRAVTAFGTAGVIDLTHLARIYPGTCALLGAFSIPAPDQPAR